MTVNFIGSQLRLAGLAWMPMEGKPANKSA
jgi:hypothetical protein